MNVKAKKDISKIKLYFLAAAIFISFPILSDFYVGHTGHILVATEGINHDPNFSKTVIYVFDHSLWGARGIIINKPIENKKDFFHAEIPHPVFKGGPVFFPDLRIVAIEQPKAVNRWRIQDLFVFDYQSIDEILSPAQQKERDDIRVYIGVTGWSFGQLEREIKMGAWDVQDFHYSYLNEQDLWNTLTGKDSAAH